MADPTTGLDDDLADFTRRVLTLEGTGMTVHVAGEGPAVIVMPEMPGISPDVARFARWVREAGFTVYLPSLFGVDGAYPSTALGEPIIPVFIGVSIGFLIMTVPLGLLLDRVERRRAVAR